MRNLLLLLFLFACIHLTAQSGFYITSSDSTRLYIRDFGSGEPLVILAGGPGLNAVYMKPVWEYLSQKFHCYVLDQRGTGQSRLASLDSNTCSLSNYVNDLEALRRYIKIDKMTLIGHSWGGQLSMEYTARNSRHVKQLVLLGTAGPTKNYLAYYVDNFFVRLHEEDLIEMAELDSSGKDRLKGYWPGFFFDRKRALATKATTNFDELSDEPYIMRFIDYHATDDERKKLLKKFKGKVSIIQGRQDPMGESTAFEIKELMPQSKVYFIEKCGHLPWLENPEQVKIFFDTLNDSLK